MTLDMTFRAFYESLEPLRSLDQLNTLGIQHALLVPHGVLPWFHPELPLWRNGFTINVPMVENGIPVLREYAKRIAPGPVAMYDIAAGYSVSVSLGGSVEHVFDIDTLVLPRRMYQGHPLSAFIDGSHFYDAGQENRDSLPSARLVPLDHPYYAALKAMVVTPH